MLALIVGGWVLGWENIGFLGIVPCGVTSKFVELYISRVRICSWMRTWSHYSSLTTVVGWLVVLGQVPLLVPRGRDIDLKVLRVNPLAGESIGYGFFSLFDSLSEPTQILTSFWLVKLHLVLLLLLDVPWVVLEEHLFESFVILIWTLARVVQIFFLFCPPISWTLQIFSLVKDLVKLFQVVEVLQVTRGSSCFWYTITHFSRVIYLLSCAWQKRLKVLV